MNGRKENTFLFFKPGDDLRERVNNRDMETSIKSFSFSLYDRLSNRQAKEIVEVFFEEIGKALQSGERVQLSGFGNFDVRQSAERPDRNPKTGEYTSSTARRTVTFQPGQKLQARIEQ